MSFSFQNMVTLTRGRRLQSEPTQYLVLLSDEGAQDRVTLNTGNENTPIANTEQLFLSGSGYATFEDAKQAGLRWRQHVMVALAHYMVGAEFGPVAEDVAARRGYGTLGEQFYDGQKGLQVFDADEGVHFLYGEAIGEVLRPVDGFATGPLRDQLALVYVPHPQTHELAYSLIHAAHFEVNNESAHVILVTALESVIGPKRQKRDEPIPGVLAALKAVVKGTSDISDTIRQVLFNGLGQIKTESISECGRRVCGELLHGRTYRDLAPDEFFDTVYRMRNAIVHGRTPVDGRPTAEQLQEIQWPLFEFVLDLLQADLMPATEE